MSWLDNVPDKCPTPGCPVFVCDDPECGCRDHPCEPRPAAFEYTGRKNRFHRRSTH